MGTPCDDGNPNTINDLYTASCQCIGTPIAGPCTGDQVVVRIAADNNAAQLSWEITNGNTTIASGILAAGNNNSVVNTTACLGNAPACYGFRLHDSFGDGIANGGWELRTTTGGLILKDSFSSGSVSPANPPATAAYGSAHSFCLPLGPANIETARCGVFNYALGNKIFANKVTGATQYEFEFTDPDAGFMRRVVRTNNYVQFWDMVVDPLTPGVKYFVRVRTDKNGPLASAYWGTGCEVGLGIAETVLCSGLIPAPLYGHSCNEVRTFNTNNSFIYATPVTGATEYQFRIYNTGEGYDQTFTRSTYILQLKWNSQVAPPLVNGNTYHVQINVKVNGLYSGFCASTCTITINNNPVLGGRLAQVEGQPEINLWPNPNDGQQLNVAVNGIDEQITTAEVRLLDLTGRMALSTQLPVANGSLNSILELNGAANGTYLLQITAGDRTWTERVVVNK
ncbi:MAG: T9SS type A sorting domain-containing protein [Bacteroidetes bacterium]|nr:T9SS type A sorting domain-containing protein [Bacteroidota bacterium]